MSAASKGERATRHSALADELRAKILSGDLAEGSYLPGERELVAQTGYSRGSVREAIRTLEAEGLVRTHVAGRYGGSRVHYAPGEPIRRMLDMFMRNDRVRFATLLQTREAIEPMLAYLAALNRTEADLAALREATSLVEAVAPDYHHLAARNIDWHLAVARASHNELLAAVMTGISAALLQASVIETQGSNEMYRGLVRAHRRILDAIIAHDAPAARRRMERHLKAYAGDLGAKAPPEVKLVL